jgi:hypothetical protein
MLGSRQLTVAGIALCICFFQSFAAEARRFVPDPNLPDTFSIGSAFTQPNLASWVPLFVFFDEPLSVMEFTIRSTDAQLTLDSVSFKSGIFPAVHCHWIALTEQSVAVVVVPPSGELLAPHSGLVGRVHITPAPGVSDISVVLDTATFVENFLEHTTYFSDSTFGLFRPRVVPGVFTVFPFCCEGTRGNIDDSPDGRVDISDLSVLIGYLYLGNYSTLPCFAEADLDQPPDNAVDISDLSLLIDYLYINPGATPLPQCE